MGEYTRAVSGQRLDKHVAAATDTNATIEVLYFLYCPCREDKSGTRLDNKNIRGLNLAVVKLTTVQMTRQPLQHKICKMGMICHAKPILTKVSCVVQKQKFFYNMLYVRNVHLTKSQAYS
jgi:hypothetical protein